MRLKTLMVAACLGLSLAPSSLALAQQGEASAQAQSALSTESPIGALLDDPAARAVLAEHLDNFVDNPQITSFRRMPLSMFQRLSRPEAFPQSVLEAIGTDLAAAPSQSTRQSASSAARDAAMTSVAPAARGADATVGELLDDPHARSVLARELPALVNAPDIARLRPLSLRTLQQIAPQALSTQTLNRVSAALSTAGDAQ